MHCAKPQRGGRRSAMTVPALLAAMALLPGALAGAESPPPRGVPPAPVKVSQLGSAPGSDALLSAVRRGEDAIKVTAAEVQAQGAQAAQLLITADKPIAAYQDFALSDPPRVVVEISGATDAIRGSIPSPPDGPVKGDVRHTQYKERPVPIVRLVVDLKSTLPYRVEAAANQLRASTSAVSSRRSRRPP